MVTGENQGSLGIMDMMTTDFQYSSQLRKILLFAGIYYLICGITGLAWPASWYAAAGITPPESAITVRAIGALMLPFGAGLCIAANAPGSAWLLILVSLAHSLLDVLAVVAGGISGEISSMNALIFVVVDLFWAIAMAAAFKEIYARFMADYTARDVTLEEALNIKPLRSERTLAAHSEDSPLAFVLLRHSGCTFCREHLTYLAREQEGLKKRGVQLVLVSMSRPDQLRELAASYGLGEALLVSDPAQSVYRGFGMKRGRIKDLFGLPEFMRAIVGGRIFKFGIGWIDGDGFQLHGTTLVYRSRIVAVRAASRASEICTVSQVIES
jgi:peroxiredoxin